MPRKRQTRQQYRKPPLTVTQVLAWADDYKRRNVRWPHHFSGRIALTDETWLGIDSTLRQADRGLPGGSSLAKVLYLHRGVRSPRNVPLLDEQKILSWCRSHQLRTGAWPTLSSGAIADAAGEIWGAIDLALSRGTRGLPGGSSLAQLLAAAGAKRNAQRLPPLSEKQILAWADAFHAREGDWPRCDSGSIAESPGETWRAIDKALIRGRRGLPGRSSLAAFLNQHRGLYKGKSRRPKRIHESERLQVEVIVTWGKAHRRRTGAWPNRNSGPVAEVPNRNWLAVDSALKNGFRGLPPGSSLAKLFRGMR